jgi:hypothetical protein
VKISTAKPAPRRFQRANLLTSLMLVFPLFLVYQVGVLAIPQVYNGADLITSQLLRLLHGQLAYYLLLNGALTVVFLILLAVLRRKNEFHPRMFIPVLVESALYAVTMGSLIVFVMQNVLHVDPRLAVAPEAPGPLAKVVLSFGAGVHEELVFRLMMVPGFTALFEKVIKLRRWIALTLAFLASAVLFSAAHHVIGGEPWRIGVFVYRLLCGLVFATIFQTRGFAVAVYTHALYDVFVLLIQG